MKIKIRTTPDGHSSVDGKVRGKYVYFALDPELAIKCAECNRLLAGWYCYVMYGLKRFIPKDFKHLCCYCKEEFLWGSMDLPDPPKGRIYQHIDD